MADTLTLDSSIFNNTILGNNDPRMRFRNSADPIYVAFDYLDNQSVGTLASSFVKDSVADVMNFVEQVKNVIKG